jgi:WD40 repeat protein
VSVTNLPRTWVTTAGHMNRITQLKAVGNTLISSSMDGSIKTWNFLDGTLYHTVQAHDKSVQKMIWADDNDYMISVGREGSIKVWKYADNQLIALGEFRGKATVIRHVEHSNGRIAIESSIPGNKTSKQKMVQLCDFQDVIEAAFSQ